MSEGEVTLLRDVEYQLDEKEIYRLLGYRKGKELSSGEVRNVVDIMKAGSDEFIVPRGAYILKEPGAIAGSGPFEKAELVALGLCTIGSLLEEKVRELFGSGEYLQGLVLDTIGSVAADSVADRINHRICDVAGSAGLTANRRSSPGHGGWSLENQKLFFDLLPHADLGMELTPSYMMIPRKSISFAVNLMKNGKKAWVSSRCSRCGMLECQFREHDERGNG